MKRLPHNLLTLAILTLVIISSFVPSPFVKTAASQETITINTTAGLGTMGRILATPPASCTSVPDGFIGDCTARADAALQAWADGNFAHGRNWNELENGSVAATTNRVIGGILPPPSLAPSADIGTSWIPEFCNHGSCGHLLKGDALIMDENGDGVVDETWYDDDNDGIRDDGEVDRVRADQFAWGATSSITTEIALDTKGGDGTQSTTIASSGWNNLGGPHDLQIVQQSGVSPPGYSRARTRAALGEELTCINVNNVDCVLDGVVETPFSIADDFSEPGNTSTFRDNNEFFGYCDLDKFVSDGDIFSIQRQLDNCLLLVGAFPTTGPKNAHVTGERNAVRTSWIDQRVIKYTASVTPDIQDFAQSWLVHYGFARLDPYTNDSEPIESSLYENGMGINQTDFDPNPSINVAGIGFPDTYDSAFLTTHNALARRYGEDNEGNAIVGFVPDPAFQNNVNGLGLSNPTVNPFWLVGSGDLETSNVLDRDMDTDPESGVGEEKGFKFLYAQEVEGTVVSCLGCGPGHDVVIPGGPLTYDQIWPLIPDINIGSHPPALSEQFNIVPAP